MEPLTKKMFFHKGTLYTFKKFPGENHREFYNRSYSVVRQQPDTTDAIQTEMRKYMLEQYASKGCVYKHVPVSSGSS